MITKVRNIILAIGIIVSTLAYGNKRVDSVFDGSTYAVVIGISDYQNVRDLKYAHKDAAAFAEYLQSEAGGAVPKQNIKRYVNEEATAINIGDAFIWINQVAFEGDRVFIFFAGHGDVEALNEIENGLLLLHKAPASSYFAFGNDYLPVYEVKKFMKTLTNKKVDAILITDACRSGKLAGGLSGNQRTSEALSESWSNEIKILSCLPDELSQEGAQWGNGRGVFSYHLIQGLKGMADSNADGVVKLKELEHYLVKNVTKEAAPAKQTPSAFGNMDYTISYVDDETLAALRTQKEKEYQTFASVNVKGFEKTWFNKNDSSVYYHYSRFQKALLKGQILYPEKSSAFFHYKALQGNEELKDLERIMQRNLAAALQERAMKIIVPVLQGHEVEVTASELQNAANGLEKAIELLGQEHYMVKSMKARKYFLEAAAVTLYLENNTDSVEYFSNISYIIKLLQKSIELEPNAAYAYYGMGYACYKGKKYDKALRAYKSYLTFVPNNANAYSSIGNIYLKQKQHKKALYYFQKSIDLDSSRTDTYYNMSKSYMALGEYELSWDYFKNAMKYLVKENTQKQTGKSDEKANLFIDKANTYRDKKQYKEALKSYRDAIGLKLKDRIALFLQKLF